MTPPTLSDIERRLLACILADVRAVEASSPHRAPGDDPREWATRSVARAELPSLGVRIGCDWIGSSDAERKSRQRGLRKLETAGFVLLASAWGKGMTHAKFTDAGRLAALREFIIAEADAKPKPEVPTDA